MKEKLISATGDKLKNLNVFIDEVKIIDENNVKTLTIILDSTEMIDLGKVVMATRILNPIVDNIGLSKDVDEMDVYAKEKGEDKYE